MEVKVPSFIKEEPASTSELTEQWMTFWLPSRGIELHDLTREGLVF